MIKKFRNIKFKKKWGVFSIFVLLTFVLWFFNALNKEYTSELTIPVEYYNMPKGKANISELPNNLIVIVKTFGYNIMKYELKKNFIPFEVDLSSTSFEKLYKNDTNWFYTLTKEYIEQIDIQFKGDIKVELLKPDTLYFHFTQLKHKKVPVIANANIVTADQYVVINTLQFKPDSVVLKGPALILDTLNNVETKYFEYLDVSSSISKSVKLKEIDGIEIIPNEVNFTLNIEEYTELSFKVNITSLNVPDSVYLHLFPSYVNIVCKVGISNYKKVEGNDFEIIVDYNSILENMGTKLATKVISHPFYIYDYYQTPEFVEYIIEKK